MALAKPKKLSILCGSLDFFEGIALFSFLSRVPFMHIHILHDRERRGLCYFLHYNSYSFQIMRSKNTTVTKFPKTKHFSWNEFFNF